MNVARLVSHFPAFQKIRYGLGPTFYHLSKEQAKLGINTHVICKREPHEKRFEEIEGIHVHRVSTPYNVTALFELAKLNRRMKVDLVHSHATSCLSYAVLKNAFQGKFTKAKYVVHVHGTTKGVVSAYHKFAPNILDEMKTRQKLETSMSTLRQNIAWNAADVLLVVSRALIDELTELYGILRDKIHVVYNGVDLRTFYHKNSRAAILKRHRIDPNSYVALYLGGFRPVKGPFFFIKALEKVSKETKNFKVLFVGDLKHPLEAAYAKPLMNQIKNPQVWDAIRLLDNMPYYRLPEYYSAVDALVVPSVYDAFPKVALEAMACETPVIASAVGGLTELILNGETGILAKPCDPEDLAEAITKLASDPEFGKTIALAAKKIVEERFTWTHAGKRLLDLYERLLKN